jgi:outer membrane protein assembly factor BamB
MTSDKTRSNVLAKCLLAALAATLTAPAARAGDTGRGDREVAFAQRVQQLTGISSGLCGVVGCDDPSLPLALARDGRFFVHVLDPRAEAVSVARTAVDRDGLYGKRIVVEMGELGALPYATGTVDLVIAADLDAEQLEKISAARLTAALRPGGKALLGSRRRSNGGPAGVTAEQLRKWLTRAGHAPTRVVDDPSGVWAVLTGPPRSGVDWWPLWEHGPDNNPVSSDTAIEAPYMTQWLGAPLYIAMPAITTAAGGRLFIAMGHIAHHQREEPWLNTLLARSAYNGSVLWKLKLPDGYLVHRSAFIATDETFYMIDLEGRGCLLLDPETGIEKGRITIPEVRGDQWMWMTMLGDVLYVLTGKDPGPAETTIVRSPHTHWSWGELSKGYYEKRVPWGFGTAITAYDLTRKKTLWTHREGARIDSRAMVVGGGHVFFYGPDSRIGCLDATTGSPVWTNDDAQVMQLIEEPGHGLGSTPGFRSCCFSLYTPDALLFEAQTRMNIVAVSTRDGKMLWQRRKTTNNPNMIYTDDRLYVGVGADGNTLAIEPQTGEVLKDLGFKKRSCARLTATPESFFCRGWPEGLTRYDRKTGQVQFNGAFRPSCNDGVVPAGGLLFLGPWPCDCNLSVMGRVALCSAKLFQPDPKAATTRRLERGQGDLRQVEPLDVAAGDWPTYRANASRTAASPSSVGQQLTPIWQWQPPAEVRLTAPTAAGGLIFVGGDDGKVRAVDGGTGQLRWNFLTAGPVMAPPTISAGRAYVGSGDGHVYALEAQTGRLLWRFRVAPAERRIMVYGSLCSTWPINGNVLVRDGIAYAAAGIVDYDGTYVCALDAVSGKPKWVNDSSGHLDPNLRKGVSAQGTLTIADGRLWMAGGNIISPAAYDLETGRYLSGSVDDGSPRANRGEETAVFQDRYVIVGGRLRFSAVRNIVNPGLFTAQAIQTGKRLGPALPINTGKIPPAWDNQLVALVNGRDQAPECYTANKIAEYLERGDPKRRPAPKWVANALKGSDVVSMAIARDAILAVCATPKFRDWRSNWRLCLLDRASGALKSQQNLPSDALPGGLLVDRDGRVVVVMQDGRIAAFGGPKSLAVRP